ncbi:MAG TPA: hypothetical protein PKY19_01105 [Oscillospiraceae bacterium]|nr:hypothetical protein [Oscillospiraceae bacterium]HXK77067.1 hypothetical protein [Oscillospiraceae bacterium]
MENVETIPKEEKNWLGKEIFEWRGRTWIYMGAWAGWMEADEVRWSDSGTTVGYREQKEEKRAAEALSMLKNTARRLASEL